MFLIVDDDPARKFSNGAEKPDQTRKKSTRPFAESW